MDRLPQEIITLILEHLESDLLDDRDDPDVLYYPRPQEKCPLVAIYNFSLTNHNYCKITTPILHDILDDILHTTHPPPWRSRWGNSAPARWKCSTLNNWLDSLRFCSLGFRRWIVRNTAPTRPYHFWLETMEYSVSDTSKFFRFYASVLPAVFPDELWEGYEVVGLLGMVRGMSDVIRLTYHPFTEEIEVWCENDGARGADRVHPPARPRIEDDFY